MAGIVKIEYKMGGEDAVKRSFLSIIQAAQRTAVARVRMDRDAATRAKQGANEELRHFTKMQLEKSRVFRESMAGMSKERMAALRADASKEGAMVKASAARAIAEEKNKTAIVIAEGRNRARATERETRERLAAERRAAASAQRITHGAIGAVHRDRGSNVRDFAAGAGRGFRSAVGGIAAVGGMVAGGIGAGTVLEAGRAQLALGKRAALLQNSTGDEKTDFVGLAKGISNVVGEDAGSVMGGVEKIAAKSGAGGLAEAKGELLEIMKLAKGAGVDMGDMGDVVGTLANRGIKAGSFVKVLSAMVQQGKDGAVEFKDLATQLDASSGALNKFKMGQENRAMVAGGLTQLARTEGKKSPEEATNAVVDLARDLNGKSAEIKKLTGVDVAVAGTNGSQLKDITNLMPAIIEGIVKKKNGAKLEGAGGIFTGNATSISTPLMQAFTLGLKKGKDGRFHTAGEGETADIKGRGAVEALLKQYNTATQSKEESEKAFKRVVGTDAEKLSAALNKLKNDLGTQLAEPLSRVAPKVVELVSALGRATAWAIDNPGRAITGVIVASIGKEMAGVGLSKVFDAMMNRFTPNMNVTATNVNMIGAGGAAGNLLGGAAGGAASGGLGGAASGAFGATGLRAIAGAGAGALGFASAATLAAGAGGLALGWSTGQDVDKDLRRTDTFGSAMEANSIVGAIRGGKERKGDRERLTELQQTMRAEQDKSVAQRFFEGATGGFRNGGADALGTAADLWRTNGASAIMMGARGGLGAALGQQQAQGDTSTREALVEIAKVLAQPKPDDAVVAAVNAMGDRVASAVTAAQLQGPKVQAP